MAREPDDKTRAFERLREQAEALVNDRPVVAGDHPEDILGLINELRIHQAELEIQNEELKHSREEIAALQREYEDLYLFAPCGYLVLNSKGLVQRANLTAVAMLGAEDLPLFSMALSSFIAPDCLREYFQALKQVANPGNRPKADLRLVRPDGSSVWVQADLITDQDEGGEARNIRLTLADIGARKAAEAAQKASEGRFRALFDNIQDAVLLQPQLPDGRPGPPEQVNRAACEMLGCTVDEFAALSAKGIAISDFHTDVFPKEMQQSQEEWPTVFDAVHLAKDGRRISLEVSSTLFDIDGIPCFLSVARDVTERKRLERLKEDVERVVRHDLKSPLIAIGYLAQLLLMEETTPERREYLKDICGAVHRMARLIDLSMELFKMERGEYKPEPKPSGPGGNFKTEPCAPYPSRPRRGPWPWSCTRINLPRRQ